MTWEEEEDLLKVEQERLAADYQKAQDAFRSYSLKVGEHIDRRLNSLSDEEIMASEELRRWLCKASWDHGNAHRRMEKLTTYGSVTRSGMDGREEWQQYILPTARLCLERDSKISDYVVWIIDFFVDWGLGRPDLPLSIMESTLSASGSYRLTYRADGPSSVDVTRWGQESVLHEGDLYTCLEYVAKNHPYNHGHEDDWCEPLEDW